MLSIGGVLFPIYWWCKVLSMVCTVCCLCGVVLVVVIDNTLHHQKMANSTPPIDNIQYTP
jgi:hypothetical protein